MHLRDITRHQQPLPFAIGHDAELHVKFVVQHQRQRLVEIALAKIAGELRITQQIEDILTIIFRPAQPKMLLGKAVTPENGALFGGQDHRIRQRLGTAAETLNQIAQFTPSPPVAELHLVKTIKQRFPAGTPGWWRHGAVEPQPVRQPHQIVKMPQQHRQHAQ